MKELLPDKARFALSDCLLTAVFVSCSFVGTLGRLGSDTILDEANYCGISWNIWVNGEAATLDHIYGGSLFKDNPILVPLLLAPVFGSTDSVQAARLAHWLLFVLPGLLAAAYFLRPAGRLAMTVGFSLLLLLPFQLSYATSRVNLDAGLASWGLIAIFCFVTGRALGLGLFSIAVATLCKYQAVVVCLVLLGCTLPPLCGGGAWKRLLSYGAASGGAMLLWIFFVLRDDPHFFAYGFDRFATVSKTLPNPWVRLFGLYPAILTPFAVAAAVGILGNWKNLLLRALALYLLLTLAFNLYAIRMPGGMNFYFTTAYLPLAVCGGYLAVGRGIRLDLACLLLVLACAKGFLYVPLPIAGYLSLIVAFLGIVAWALRSRWAAALLVGAPVVLVLPRALDLEITAQPDQSIRALASRSEQNSWRSGTWEDPRVVLWSHPPAIPAKYLDHWEAIDYFIVYREGERQPDPNWQARFADFEAFLAANYQLDREFGMYAGYRRRPAASKLQ